MDSEGVRNMRLTAASLTLALALGTTSLFAQGQSNPPAPVPAQPGQPTQPGQPARPGQPTQPGQGSTPSQPGSRAAMSSQQGADREVTITGCVGRDTTKPVAGGQATDGFMLTNVRPATGAAADARGSANAAQAPGRSGDMSQQYRLMAKGDVNFAPHLNHQVRLTGTMMGGPSGRGAMGSTTAGAATPAPMFHVTQLTMVSATCDTK